MRNIIKPKVKKTFSKKKSFKPTKKRTSRNNDRLQMFNSHINFNKEKRKGNSRKDETELTCVQCKKKFILPFKPRDPEVYCDECFKAKDKGKKKHEKRKIESKKNYKKPTSKKFAKKTNSKTSKEKKKFYDANKNKKNKKS